MTLIVTFLVLISIIGWASLLSDDETITLYQATFTVMAAMGSLMMMAFILQIPIYSARLILYGGWVALPVHLLIAMRTRSVRAIFSQYKLITIAITVAILMISLMAWDLQFSSIDDYSFWGTISRFLFVFNHLPENAQLIKASFLQYTPGLACFHYLFYQLADFYSPMLNYIAQDLILLAPLLLFIDRKQPWHSVITIMIIIITLYLAYGNILAKLEVDATVAMWFFAMLWVAIQPKKISIWTMFFGLIFLSIIKEIGLLFSLFTVGVHYLCHRKQPGQLKRLMMLLSGIMIMKLAWLYHVNQFGFASFAERITMSKALTALIPGHPDYVKSQVMFLKGLLSSNFDHIIKMPFAALFILSGWQIHRLLRLSRLKTHYVLLFKAFFFLLPFYIINIYWLQAIVFRVGYQQTHLLDFPRYFNMVFVPFILSVLVVSLNTKPLRHLDNMKKWATVLSMLALIFIVGGKIERIKKYYHPFDFTHLAEVIQTQTMDINKTKSICLTHLPDPDYQVLMPLQYRLMPNQIKSIENQKSIDCGQILDFSELNR